MKFFHAYFSTEWRKAIKYYHYFAMGRKKSENGIVKKQQTMMEIFRS